jgi:site-specific DNA-methyltransferase (adenine-specific)
MLYLGDCLNVIPTLSAASVDLILCDLPYGTTQNKWDSIIPLDRLWTEYWRVAKSDAAIVLTSAQPFTSVLVSSAINFYSHEWMWHKTRPSGHLNANRQPMRDHESVLVFAKETYTYNPQFSHGAVNHKTNGKKSLSTNYGAHNAAPDRTDGVKYPRTVQSFKNVAPTDSKHPTQKPIALMEYLIRTYTNEGNTVLDNCMGSGTTGVACNNTGRKFIGIERDPAYFEIARKRVEPFPWE